ncbi:MAG: ABC transporter ATP-binding protein, partial [Acidobacteriota bacterium]|nr:ABC transporter ATP-binding protein [Acidobacteriota bacterium]
MNNGEQTNPGPIAGETEESPFSRRLFQMLFRLARQYRRQFLIVTLLSFLYTGLDLLQPLVYRRAINDVAGLFIEQTGIHPTTLLASRTPAQTLRTLFESVALLFLIAVASYYVYLRADYYGARVASFMESKLIVDTFAHVMRLPLRFFDRQASAGLAKRIDQCDQLSPVVHAFSQQIAPEAMRLIGICLIMLTQNWEMALVSVCLLPPYMWIARRSALRLRSNLDPYYEMWEDISARIADALGAVKTVKLSGAEGREEERLRDESTRAYSIYLDRIRTAQTYYISQTILSNLSKALVLGYGGWLVLRNSLTPGDVVMFAVYLDRLYSPIDSLNSLAVSLQQNLTSVRRAVRLLDSGPVESEGFTLRPGPGRVEFHDVHFGYVEGREVLRGLSLTLEPGKITALAGPSGAGKTTTADLLLKLFEPWSGDIFIDGQPLSQIGCAAVRAAIGVVASDGAVFRGTLAENIRYKRPHATDREVLDAALAAGLGRALERLPEGIATTIGERGIGLSMGERQRLQIARLLVDKPRLLVLDEATANLDYATEIEVRNALETISPRPTMLVIAHRYTMMKNADYVYILRDGSIVEEGAPERLLAGEGWFAEMARQSGENPHEAP